jgi:similar to stage IV sporulation protein
MLPEVFYFLKGYVIIKTEGSFPEKFINMALCKNVYIWDIKKVDRNTVTMKMSTRGFLLVKDLSARAGCNSYIIGESGLLHLVKKYKKRSALIIGLFAFLSVLSVMSAFVWDIEVSGNERTDTGVIMAQLKSAGLKNGAYIKNIDIDGITRKVMAQNNEISWIGINIKGTKASVEIAEGAPKPDIFDKDIVCSIVSEKDGVVDEIITRTGFPVVKKGDTVHKGQLLVSGVTDSPAVGVRGVHSDADIMLKCWYDKQASVALEQTRTVPLGEEKTRYSILAGNKTIKLYFGKEPYEEFELKTEDKYSAGKLKLKKNIYTKIKTEKYMLSEADAVDRAKKQIENEIKDMIGESGSITDVKYAHELKNGYVNVYARIETKESAGEKTIINQ